MSDFEIYAMLAVLAIPAIGLLWIWRKWRAPFVKKNGDAYIAKFRARLASPDFAAIEAPESPCRHR